MAKVSTKLFITIKINNVHICQIKHAPNDSDVTRICAAKYTVEGSIKYIV